VAPRVGGFWRISDGVRDPGFRANDGYQARVSLGRDLPGGGKIDANVKHFDDHVVFFSESADLRQQGRSRWRTS
jgi:hypothetical protein